MNLVAALHDPDITEQCVYFNDDFYVTSPLELVPVLHGGPAVDYHPRDEIGRRFRKTIAALDDPDALTYDGTHVPLPIVRDDVLRALQLSPGNIKWRTWYGNMCHIGGEWTRNVKIHSKKDVLPDGPFLSSAPQSLTILREYLEDVLPKRSAYA
jgi:hypothetical protein